MQYDDRIAYSESELYALSRSLKFKAREKRKVRLEKEAVALKKMQDSVRDAREKAELDKKAREAKVKTDYDDRVRKMLLAMADAVKAYGFAFEGPENPYHWATTNPKGAQTITFVDTKRIPGQDMADYTFGKRTTVKTTHNGFHWD